MPYTNTPTETDTELYPWHTRGLQPSHQGAETFSKIQSLRRSFAISSELITEWPIQHLPQQAERAEISVQIFVAKDDNLCGCSTTPGIPPHPRVSWLWAGEIVFMLYLRSTALWKLGMQHWLFSVNQYPGGPWKPRGFNLEHHRCWISEKHGPRGSHDLYLCHLCGLFRFVSCSSAAGLNLSLRSIIPLPPGCRDSTAGVLQYHMSPHTLGQQIKNRLTERSENKC